MPYTRTPAAPDTMDTLRPVQGVLRCFVRVPLPCQLLPQQLAHLRVAKPVSRPALHPGHCFDGPRLPHLCNRCPPCRRV